MRRTGLMLVNSRAVCVIITVLPYNLSRVKYVIIQTTLGNLNIILHYITYSKSAKLFSSGRSIYVLLFYVRNLLFRAPNNYFGLG